MALPVPHPSPVHGVTDTPPSNTAAAPLVTCTFCWHATSGPAHVLGRAARIACTPCYAALLDLAICWSCGEVVFRGDECVSLGWCFWHRACYGCLFCGSRVVYRGVGVRELFEEEDGGAEVVEQADDLGRGKGREIDRVPLCVDCAWEAGAEEMDRRAVEERGLKRVERVDGGLTRRRWEARQWGGKVTTMFKRKIAQGYDLHRASPLRHVQCESIRYEPVDQRDAVNQVVSELSAIYVSISDPIGQLAFKPSPTKPIPTWMQPKSQNWMEPESSQPGRTQQSLVEAGTEGSYSPLFEAKRIGPAPVLSEPLTAERFESRKKGIRRLRREYRDAVTAKSSRGTTPCEPPQRDAPQSPTGKGVSGGLPENRTLPEGVMTRLRSPVPTMH